MLEYDRIDVSGETNVSKTNGLSECIICHYRSILEINFRFQSKVGNGCHDLMQKAMSFNEFANLKFKRNYYRIHFWYMSKDKTMNL